MLSRLPIRTLLAAAAALAAGFVAAFFVLDFTGDQLPDEPLIQIAAAYLTWVAVALVAYLLVRRLVPPGRRGTGEVSLRHAPPPEAPPPGDRETP